MSQRNTPAIYQLKGPLQGIPPLIWRRIEIRSRTTLPQLHRILQIVMGWENYHLHEILIAGKAYGEPDRKITILAATSSTSAGPAWESYLGAGSSFEYHYDFGDN